MTSMIGPDSAHAPLSWLRRPRLVFGPFLMRPTGIALIAICACSEGGPSQDDCAQAKCAAGGSSADGGEPSGSGGVPGSGGQQTSGSGGSALSGGSTADGGATTSSGGSTPSAGGTTASGGGAFDPAFILGADISSAQESTASYVDTDGQTKPLLDVLKNHGFNYIRLRTFVDPGAPYGYASSANGCTGKSEDYGDQAHVIAFGQQIKAAGLGFLLNFHYSDVWADPGNQIIPEAWRAASDIDALAALVSSYTQQVLTAAVAAGARPDMVQVGNEITPGMLVHVPGPDTDCWGNNPSSSAVNGSVANWDQLATLLKAGITAVREVDPAIKIMLHIENTDEPSGVRAWVQNALSRGVEFDVLGLSCYTAFQGQPSVWQDTFEQMADEFPQLQFAIAEYNPARTDANLLMKDLPDGRGLGTFFWEPTLSGEWGDALFTWQGNQQIANEEDFAEFDELLPSLGL